MYLFVIFPLVLNVLPYHVLVAVLPHGVEIEAGSPELAAPEHALHFRMAVEDFSGGDALDRSDQAGGEDIGHGLEQEVHMVFIQADLDKVDFIALSNAQTDGFEGLGDCGGDGLSAILDREDGVVEEQCLIVGLQDVLTHSSSIRERGPRGKPTGKSL